jgi:hypothetical protein
LLKIAMHGQCCSLKMARMVLSSTEGWIRHSPELFSPVLKFII